MKFNIQYFAELAPISMYGVHDLTLYTRSNGVPIGHYRVMGDVKAEFSAEIEKLMG